MLSLGRGIYSGLAQITRSNRLALHTASALRCKAEKSAENEETSGNDEKESNSVPDAKDRTKVIPVETSMRYLKSAAYKTTYGEDFVWTQYR